MTRGRKIRKNKKKSDRNFCGNSAKPVADDNTTTIKNDPNEAVKNFTSPLCSRSPNMNFQRQPPANMEHDLELSPKSTPIRRRRPRERRHNCTLNVTNLNFLFDSSFINTANNNAINIESGAPAVSPPHASNTSLSNSKSNLNEQIKNKLFENNTITETPKCHYDISGETRDNSCNNVNVNPYLKNRDLSQFVISTPPTLINLRTSTSFCEFLKDDPVKESPQNLNNHQNFLEKIDNKGRNFPFSSTPLVEITNNQEKANWLHLNNTKHEAVETTPFATTATTTFTETRCTKTINRNSARYSLRRIIEILRKCSKLTAIWAFKLIEFCLSIGAYSVKRNVSTGSCPLNDEPQSSPPPPHCDKCEHFEQSIKQLKDELAKTRSEVEHQKDCNNAVLSELNKLKMELHRIDDLKKEVEALKETLQKQPVRQELLDGNVQFFQTIPSTLAMPSAALPPQPPPPPPPPPPLPPLSTPNNFILVKSGSGRRKQDAIASRPIISLDDILKVKLKKPAERPSPYPSSLRRYSQPVVSKEMLDRVKLRPASARAKTAPTTTVTTIGAGSTNSLSPCSSLTKILSETPWRVKRLKRVSGYSFDDVSRRNEIASREQQRERTFY